MGRHVHHGGERRRSAFPLHGGQDAIEGDSAAVLSERPELIARGRGVSAQTVLTVRLEPLLIVSVHDRHARLAEQFLLALIAQEPEESRVDEPDHSIGLHQDALDRALYDRAVALLAVP